MKIVMKYAPIAIVTNAQQTGARVMNQGERDSQGNYQGCRRDRGFEEGVMVGVIVSVIMIRLRWWCKEAEKRRRSVKGQGDVMTAEEYMEGMRRCGGERITSKYQMTAEEARRRAEEIHKEFIARVGTLGGSVKEMMIHREWQEQSRKHDEEEDKKKSTGSREN